jgi:copper(I)-binding protein
MIMGLKGPLKAGDHFNLTLLFAKARPHKVDVTVKPAGAK